MNFFNRKLLVFNQDSTVFSITEGQCSDSNSCSQLLRHGGKAACLDQENDDNSIVKELRAKCPESCGKCKRYLEFARVLREL